VTRRTSTDYRGQVEMDHAPRRRVEPEASVLDRITTALQAAGGCKIMRNSCGLARHGQRVVRYGLERGSSDLVAIVAPAGRWLCVEVKRADGRVDPAQAAWLDEMRALGAVAGVCRSPEEALCLLAEARRRE